MCVHIRVHGHAASREPEVPSVDACVPGNEPLTLAHIVCSSRVLLETPVRERPCAFTCVRDRPIGRSNANVNRDWIRSRTFKFGTVLGCFICLVLSVKRIFQRFHPISERKIIKYVRIRICAWIWKLSNSKNFRSKNKKCKKLKI